MEIYEDLSFEEITEEHIHQLTGIMQKAFDADTRLHLGMEKGGPEGYDDGSFLRKYALDKHSRAFTVNKAGEIIGGVIVWVNLEKGEGFLGNIFIAPDFEDSGVGTKIWRFIEGKYPQVKDWTSETPGFSRRNHNFYVNKCGFHIVKIENPKDLMECSFVLKKHIN